MPSLPSISVIVPTHGLHDDLRQSLSAVRAAAAPGTEIIVVDDGSPTPLAGAAEFEGITLVRRDTSGGPGAARNLGAETARGELLFFVDADVVIPPDAIERVRRDLGERREYCAVFGSYDDTPARPEFLSQYKNLFHHYIHQIAAEEAGTFWAGCGAIRRDVFLQVGGFDAERYPLPSIEDIELGVRLRRAGHRILLDKKLQAKHLKLWDLRTLLTADVVRRAIPWTRLILSEGSIPRDLNMKGRHRLSAALVALLLGALPAAIWWRPAVVVALVCFAGIVGLNFEFYRYFLRARGIGFVLRVIPMHILYYFYSGATFTVLSVLHRLGLDRPSRPPIPAR